MHDVIKGNYEIKEKEWKMGSHTFGLRKEGRKFPPFDRMSYCSKLEERNEKRKEKIRRKWKENEMRKEKKNRKAKRKEKKGKNE